jgi:tetratricopeptide (TPR) repeat protein
MFEKPFQTVNRLRKSGMIKEAWQSGIYALEQQPHDTYLKNALFWVCYFSIKADIEKMNQRLEQVNSVNPNNQEVRQIEQKLQKVYQLDITTGGLESYRLLCLFKKTLRFFPTLVNYVLYYQEALFNDEAKKPYQTEKGESPSTMYSCARQVTLAWLESKNQGTINFNLVLKFIDITLKEVDDKNLIWLQYDKIKCLIALGKDIEAQSLLLPLIRQKPKESWIWAALASSYHNQNQDLALKFYAKAVVVQCDMRFCLKYLKVLIRIFVNSTQYAEAAMCLKTIINECEKNKWTIKPDIKSFQGESWFNQNVDENKLLPCLKKLSHDAINHIYGSIKTKVAIIESIHKSGKGFQAYAGTKESYPVHLKIHQGQIKPQIGDYIQLSIPESTTSDTIEVIKSRPCQPAHIEGVGTIEGLLTLSPKGFGFIKNTFVPHYLIKNLSDQAELKATQIKSWDKAKHRYGFKAIKLHANENNVST